jgi:hypothetical protein
VIQSELYARKLGVGGKFLLLLLRVGSSSSSRMARVGRTGRGILQGPLPESDRLRTHELADEQASERQVVPQLPFADMNGTSGERKTEKEEKSLIPRVYSGHQVQVLVCCTASDLWEKKGRGEEGVARAGPRGWCLPS